MSFVGYLQFGHLVRLNDLPNLFFVFAIDDYVALHVIDVSDQPATFVPLFVPTHLRQRWPWDTLRSIHFVDTSHMSGWTGYYHLRVGDRLSVSLEADPAACMSLHVIAIEQDAITAEVDGVSRHTVFLDFAFRGIRSALGLFAIARVQTVSNDAIDAIDANDANDARALRIGNRASTTTHNAHWLRDHLWLDTESLRYVWRADDAQNEQLPEPSPRFYPIHGQLLWSAIAREWSCDATHRVQHVQADELQRWRDTLPSERRFVERARQAELAAWTVKTNAQQHTSDVAVAPTIPHVFELPPSMHTRLPKLLAKRFAKAPTAQDVFFDPDLDDLDYRFLDALQTMAQSMTHAEYRLVLKRIVQAHVQPWPAHLDLDHIVTMLQTRQRPVTDNCYGVLPHKLNPRWFVFQRGEWQALKVAVDPQFANVIAARQQNSMTPYFRVQRRDQPTKVGPKDVQVERASVVPSTAARETRNRYRQRREQYESAREPLWLASLCEPTLTEEERVPRRSAAAAAGGVPTLPATPIIADWLQRNAVYREDVWSLSSSGEQLTIHARPNDDVAPRITVTSPSPPPPKRHWALWHHSIVLAYPGDHPRRIAWEAPAGALFWHRFVGRHQSVLQYLDDASSSTAEQWWWLVLHHPGEEAFVQWLQTQGIDTGARYALPRAWRADGWPTLATLWLMRYDAEATVAPAASPDWQSTAVSRRASAASAGVASAAELYVRVAHMLAPTAVPWIQYSRETPERWRQFQTYLHSQPLPRCWTLTRVPDPPHQWSTDDQQAYWRFAVLAATTPDTLVGHAIDSTHADVRVGTDERVVQPPPP